VSNRYEIRYADHPGEDRGAIARVLLDLAAATGLDHREIRTVSYGFSVPLEWAIGCGLTGLPALAPAVAADHVEAPSDAGLVAVIPALFNPADNTVAAVIKHLETADFDEQVRILAAEAEGQNRTSIARWRPKSE
jgi:hypothetical protein